MSTKDNEADASPVLAGVAALAIILGASFLWLGAGYALKQWAEAINAGAKP